MKINKYLLLLMTIGILILAVSSVNAVDKTVNIGGNTFYIPAEA
ncbi:hypothetical protein [uncultured Methanobrevibacter sp.]|nr:hypothetical protein [uncultured Methanobrevibacter sp.]